MPMSDDEILAALYDSVIENRRIEDALNLLAERFHCPSAGLISFDATIPQADSMAAIGVMGAAENLASYRNTFSTIDPAPKAFSALRQGDVSATNIIISPAQRTDVYISQRILSSHWVGRVSRRQPIGP